MSGLLNVSGLTKSYDATLAVDHVSFQVNEGETFGLLGPNGAGKTTAMRMLSGLLSPDEGVIEFQTRPIQPSDTEFRKNLGVVPQDIAIYPDLTACENLDFFGQLYGLRGQRLWERRQAALDEAGLSRHSRQRVATFSGGMKRRLNFAVAIMHQPRLLILDEPTVGVDPQSRRHLLDCVRRLNETGTGIIYASHYMEEVQALCHRAAILDHGRVLAYGPMNELLERLTPAICLKVSALPDQLLDRLRRFRDIEVTIDANPAMTDGVQLTLTSAEATSDPSPQVVNHDVESGARAGESESEPFKAFDLTTTTRQTIALLTEFGVELQAITTHEANLEQLFLNLTGHGLRD